MFCCFKYKNVAIPPSVADPGCLSRIPDPDFYPSRIPDPKTATKERGEKKIVVIPFCSHKFHKIKNYFIFEMLKEKIWANFQIIIEFLHKKLSLSSKKYGFKNRYPRSRIRDPEKTYPGSRGHKGTGSRIRIRNTGPSEHSLIFYCAGNTSEVFPAGGAQPDQPGRGSGEDPRRGRGAAAGQPQQRSGPREDLPRDLRRAQVQQRNEVARHFFGSLIL
jgi:hypothetical protein